MGKGPSSAKYIDHLAVKLLEPVKRGESAFVRWFPGHGKTVLLSYIFFDQKLLKKHLGQFYKRFLFVKVDGYLFFSQADVQNYFYYIYTLLCEELKKNKIISTNYKITNPLIPSLVLTIKKIVDLCKKTIEKGYEIVFIIDAVDSFPNPLLKQMFTVWEYIVESNRERIHTHINVNRQDIIENCVTQSGLIQNIIPISLPDRKECKHFIQFYIKKWRFKLTAKTIDSLFIICGNDPVLIKESLRIFKKRQSKDINLLAEPTLMVKTKINYELLDAKEKEVIEYSLKNSHILSPHKKIAKALLEYNFWDKNHNIPKAIEKVIIESKSIKKVVFDKKRKILIFGDFNLKKKLSATEYKILLLLYKKRGKVVNRDEIAECIWGDKMLDLYSDWAIDKAMSRLRAKLTNLSFYYQITTRKKEGFVLEG